MANGNVIQGFSFDITGKNFVTMGYVAMETHFIATGFRLHWSSEARPAAATAR